MQRNTRIIITIVFFTLISLAVNIQTLEKIEEKTITGITSKTTAEAHMNICINSPPQIESHNCTFDLIARMDGILRDDYSCFINITDPDDDELSYYTFKSFAELNLTGMLQISGNISSQETTRPSDISVPITITDNSSCENSQLTKNFTFPNITYNSKVKRIKNYTSNSTDYIELKEGYTTYHKSLDEYFKDIDGFPLNYTHTYFDVHCFDIELNIDPDTHVVSYYPNYEASTETTGPCHAKFTAVNPYGFKNYSNEFKIYVENTEKPEQQETDTSSSGGGGGGGSGGGGSPTSSFTDCRLWNVNCTEWGKCTYNPDNNTNRSTDGIQQRECTFSTNCPGEMQPEMKRVCDYKPTCSDSLKNCHENPDGTLSCEEGVDCGGPCPPCPTCDDFTQNQGEEGVDCGGPCEPCATCSDGEKNCRRTEEGEVICETGIDCGGPCGPCPNCSDGIRNCHYLENGTKLCEEGIDCGGPCEKCPHKESPAPSGRDYLLDVFFVIILAGLLTYPARVLFLKLKAYYLKKKMDALKASIIKERNTFSHNYLAHFDKQIQMLMDDFDAVTHEQAKKEGDTLLTQGESTGYNIDRYSVSFDNDYADILNDDSVMTINYAMYLDDIDHGRRILKELARNGIRANYKVCKRSSAVSWDENWGYDKNAKYEVVNGQKIARTVEYIISFRPRDKEEAKKIIKFLETYGKGTQKGKIQGAWDVPDIRVTGNEQILDYEKTILNTKSVGGQKLLILTKDKPLPGYQYKNIWLNPELSKFVK